MNQFQSSITKEELNNLPRGKFEGTVHVINNEDEFKKHWPLISDSKIIGIDTESKPSFQKGKLNKVALLQISSMDYTLLLRLNKMNLPHELLQYFEDEKILKVGAALHDDIKDLKKIQPFEAAGFLDLQKYVGAFHIENIGLQKMSGIVLGIKISKSQQTSNWENDQLTIAQISYASTDAWAPLAIYKKLQESITG